MHKLVLETKKLFDRQDVYSPMNYKDVFQPYRNGLSIRVSKRFIMVIYFSAGAERKS